MVNTGLYRTLTWQRKSCRGTPMVPIDDPADVIGECHHRTNAGDTKLRIALKNVVPHKGNFCYTIDASGRISSAYGAVVIGGKSKVPDCAKYYCDVMYDPYPLFVWASTGPNTDNCARNRHLWQNGHVIAVSN